MPPGTLFPGGFIHSLSKHSLSPPGLDVFNQITVQDVFMAQIKSPPRLCPVQGCAIRAGKACTQAITVPSHVWADITNQMWHYFSLWSNAAACSWVNLVLGGCGWILLENLPCAVSFPPSGGPFLWKPRASGPWLCALCPEGCGSIWQAHCKVKPEHQSAPAL